MSQTYSGILIPAGEPTFLATLGVHIGVTCTAHTPSCSLLTAPLNSECTGESANVVFRLV